MNVKITKINTCRLSPFGQAKKTGSALLLTLLVVSLLLVIVLSFTVYVRLALREQQNRQDLFLAQTHARLGVHLAIAQLQRDAGPDTRISAPVLDASALPHQQRITRIADAAPYKSSAGGPLVPNPTYTRNLGYLLSSDPDTVFDPLNYQPFTVGGAVASGNALLVGPGSVDEAEDENADGIPDGYVAAPFLDIGDNGEGAYAWWVGDDGTKARINIIDPVYENEGSRTDRRQAATAQRMGSEAVLPNFDPNNPDHNTLLGRLIYLDQLNLDQTVSLAPGAEKRFFHDVTLLSLGLPVNTKRGGFKRDLTAVMKEAENNGGEVNPSGVQWTQLMDDQADRIDRWRAETEALEDAGMLGAEPGPSRHRNALQALTLRADQTDSQLSNLMFPPLTDLSTKFDPGGAPWEQLITWTTLRQRRESGGGVVPQIRWGNSMELSPVISKLVLSTYASVEYPNAAMHWIPAVALWNPYNVPIKMDSGNPWRVLFDININQSAINFWMRLKVKHPNWSVPNMKFYNHIVNDELWTPRFLFRWNSSTETDFVFQLRDASGGTNVIIPPGEARIFTMHEHADLTPGTAGDSFDPTVELREGLPPVPGEFSLFLKENIHDQIFDHPIYGDVDKYGYRDGEADLRGVGYNHWQSYGRKFKSYRAESYPFPLDPSKLDPAYTGELVQVPLPAQMDMSVNRNGLDPSKGWQILEVAMEVAKTADGGKPYLPNVRIRLDRGNPDFPLAEIFHPNLQLVQELFSARIYDDDSIVQSWLPSLIPDPSTALPPGTGGTSWGLAYGLRLPENTFAYLSSGESAGAPLRWLVDVNPMAPFQMRDPSSRIQQQGNWIHSKPGFKSPPAYIGGFFMGTNEFSDLSLTTSGDLNANIGSSEEVPADLNPGEVPRAVLIELPVDSEDLVSVASLMHAPLTPTYHDLMPDPNGLPGVPLGTADRDRLPYALAASTVYQGSMQPANMIGNSRATLFVNRARAEQSFYPSMDSLIPEEIIPYAENKNPSSFDFDAWDGGYYSGIPPSYFPGYDSSWIYNEILWDDFLFTPESNTRLLWTEGSVPDDRDYTTSAEKLLINGAFNINSTSVPAWAALLSSMMEVDLGSGGNSSGTSAFSRFIDPDAGVFDADMDDYSSKKTYTGYRRLHPEDIWMPDPVNPTGLAVEIVKQVRERGPFLSMADFVNRALLPSADSPQYETSQGLAGALQAAIDAAGLNDAVGNADDSDSWIEPSVDLNVDWEWGPKNATKTGDAFYGLEEANALGRRNAGASADLSQADILARLGAVLQARSDTFTIRAEGITGEIANPRSRVWCEVTVQRLSDYVEDGATSPGIPPEDLPVNLQFGRRFRILSFRWLTREEI